jgi:hypothetical protein
MMARGCVIYSERGGHLGTAKDRPARRPPADRVGWRKLMNDSDPIADTAALAPKEFGTPARVEEQWIKLLQPVKGDPGLTVLRVLGLAQDAPTVGAAAHGPNGVAIGVWCRPELYVARWAKGKRWVVGYKLAGDAKPNMFIRTEGRIPTRLEIGNWYGPVPDEVSEMFFGVGLLIDDPPFEVPPPPAVPLATRLAAGSGAMPRPGAKPTASSPRSTAPRSAPRPRTARPAATPRPAKASSRLCPGCGLHKAMGQFVEGSDLCVDCR